MRQLILVTGAGGQLGQTMAAELAGRHEVVAMGRGDLDLSNTNAVLDAVAGICPDLIINCAAYTDVDGAEKDPSAALVANAWAVRTLARAASEISSTLVHFSTDFVFDGVTDRPYTEEDAPNPRGAYAVSKLLGEWFACGVASHYVLRVESLFGGPRARSSVDRILENLLAGREVRAFVDRTVSPSFVEDVVAATLALVEQKSPSGVYHCVNSGWTTWSELARELARLVDRPNAPIVDVPVASAKLVAERPKFAALSSAKLAAQGITMPSWQNALERHVLKITRAE
ncbi:MAG TPA: dTDP-4-dehydrorhamnose reductase [Vicinamibacterales bacterium]|nr:dTDP-4-dehydrorhamnose reductase [Vicinamibacterales bacterium]